jgi:hypothetical protein
MQCQCLRCHAQILVIVTPEVLQARAAHGAGERKRRRERKKKKKKEKVFFSFSKSDLPK